VNVNNFEFVNKMTGLRHQISTSSYDF